MTRASRAFSFSSADGSPIKIAQELGRGGEGVVYDLENRPNQVAKIYLAPIDSQKADKLHVMVSQCTPELTRLAAWPSDLVLDHKRQIAGLIMKKIAGFRPVHELYTPKSRLLEFPRANWAFLVHTATNVARAFAVMHAHGIVIGDVNHGNVVVNDSGLCVLIDCDSFQVSNNGRRFLCEVGVSAYTPPELQGKDFATFPRTENHDNFGLALLVFHLLIMGRHPFAGRYLGAGEMPVERAIREHRFAFSANSSALQMQPPPNSLGLSDLPPDLAALFEQAFSSAGSKDSGRPKAVQWIESLETLSRDLFKCPKNASHVYYKKLTKCPWCRLEEASAIIFFVQFDLPVFRSDYNIGAVWAQIVSIHGPDPAPPLNVKLGITATFTSAPDAVAAGRKRMKKNAAGFGIVLLGIVLAILAGGGEGFLTFVIAMAVAGAVWHGNEKQLGFRVAHDVAAARFESLEHRWSKEASDEEFFAKRRELEDIKRELESLPRLRHERVRHLELNQKSIQLHKFLDRHYIRSAVIPGIGPGRKAVLASYGIDTAADVNWAALQAVDGIGPHYATALVHWRKSIEAKFVFNPHAGIDVQELAKIDRELGQRRHYLQQRLSAGIPELQIIRERTISRRVDLKNQAVEAYKALQQAEADLNAC